MPPIVVERPDLRARELPSWRVSRLLDRATFFDRLQRAMVRNRGAGGGLALLVMKLDPFVVADPGSTGDRREEVHMVSAGRLIGCLHHACVPAGSPVTSSPSWPRGSATCAGPSNWPSRCSCASAGPKTGCRRASASPCRVLPVGRAGDDRRRHRHVLGPKWRRGSLSGVPGVDARDSGGRSGPLDHPGRPRPDAAGMLPPRGVSSACPLPESRHRGGSRVAGPPGGATGSWWEGTGGLEHGDRAVRPAGDG